MTETVFFLSDTHFTYHNITEEERKKRSCFLSFLEWIRGTDRLYLVGDIFDFWFEYRYTIPRDYHDILDGLFRLHKSGTTVYMTGGNHDYWLGSYLSDTLGMKLLPPMATHNLQGRSITLTHGDMMLPGDYAYKALKSVIRSRMVISLARSVHPDILFAIARRFSRASKDVTHKRTEKSAKTLIRMAPHSFFRWNNDVFVMGHTHYPYIEQYGEKIFVILGDWEVHHSYLRLEGGELFLEYYRPPENTLIEKR